MARKLPTKEQIEKVNEIAQTLGIYFPQSANDFSFRKYRQFILLYQHDYELWCENADLMGDK